MDRMWVSRHKTQQIVMVGSTMRLAIAAALVSAVAAVGWSQPSPKSDCFECEGQNSNPGRRDGKNLHQTVGAGQEEPQQFDPEDRTSWKDDFLYDGDGGVWDGYMEPSSYEYFSYDYDDWEDYDCSSCAWDNMSELQQRLLTQRSRSMVCDASCLLPKGDSTYGVMMCNYFDANKACRACCHEGHMVEGCMPCEGEGTCDTCMDKIREMCMTNPCEQECQAHVCCSMRWNEYSGCVEKMPFTMAEIVDYISSTCSLMFSCDAADVVCSDNARTCSARGTVSRHRLLQALTHKITCSVVRVSGAGGFDMNYAFAGTFEGEMMFRAIGGRRIRSRILRSVSFDGCAKELKHLSFFSSVVTEVLVAHSNNGYLMWNGGTEPIPYVVNTGVGCVRRIWLLYDTKESMEYSYITVDPSDQPLFIVADWIKLQPGGDMSLGEVSISCDSDGKEGKGNRVLF